MFVQFLDEQGELVEEVAVSKMEITTQHDANQGKTQNVPVNYYNLDAVISVGYAHTTIAESEADCVIR